MTALMSLVRKDLLQYLGNRRALLINLLAPILIAAFFGSLFGGKPSGKPAPVPLAVVDQDDSALSHRLLTVLAAEPHLSLQRLAPEPALEAVRRGTLRAALILPKGFGEQAGLALFGAGPQPQLALHIDPSQRSTLALVQGLLTQHLMAEVSRSAMSPQGANWQRLREQAAQADMPTEQRAELAQLFDSVAKVQARSAAGGEGTEGVGQGLRSPFALQEHEVTAKGQEAGYNGYAHSFAGMGVQFILMLGVEMAVALLLMRRQDLWKRLRAAPLSRGTLLGSRVLSTALIALFSFVLIMLAGMAVFGVRVLGSGIGFALLLVSFALFTASFGLLVAALGRNPEATRGMAILATLLMVMLGGAWVPSFVFPEWLQTVTLAMPTRWAVDGLDAMTWRGLGLEAAWAPCGVLLGASLLCGLLAWWRFDWEE
ncbi:ABC-2 type transport system permease protein [Inhella inkyongensis]|uniref:ABC-2 type transport system permease protein n=1 Tax=Inhella inkyongensis TaxID=392593 RepID=A0A840S244_9BURK|nr:ABC transporter permease [Inhella inkyongensis]MBB5202751.1 ABC-2 type transport system permease protein [Inhella inkyongensis]